MDEIKSYLKNMLKWLHDFCEENKICYYALGGTLLGAVRHKGFIPWDDDIDVGMPRQDYEKFIKLMANEKGRYILESPEFSSEEFCYTFSKLYDTETTLIENTKHKIKRGLYIDIFPIDGIGATYDQAIKNYKPLSIIQNIYTARTVGIKKNRSKIKNLAVILMKFVPQFIINDKKLQSKICNRSKKFDFASSKFCGNLMGAYRNREIVEKGIFGSPILLEFEDIKINAPEKPVEYLKHIYGDWEALPPVEKRISNHDFIEINLNKSYLS